MVEVSRTTENTMNKTGKWKGAPSKTSVTITTSTPKVQAKSSDITVAEGDVPSCSACGQVIIDKVPYNVTVVSQVMGGSVWIV